MHFGDWTFNYSENSLVNTSTSSIQRLEPKIADLLNVFLLSNGEVLSRDYLIAELWPNTIVGEDTLARTVSRLRSELSDSASAPKFIETIPKKGYRFIEKVKPAGMPNKTTISVVKIVGVPMAILILLLIAWLLIPNSESDQIQEQLSRADSLYMQFDEQSNEAAIALYEQVLLIDDDNARANAGVANAIVQRLVRWPSAEYSVDNSGVSLTKALASGQLSTPQAKLMLERAKLIAEKAVRQSPEDVHALKSLGFVYSAQGQINQAIEQYRRAINIDSNAWRSLINLGELYSLNNEKENSLNTFIDAYQAMQIKFSEEPQHIGPWQPELGKIIASSYVELGDEENAQRWAEKVLTLVPFEREASTILVESLRRSGKQSESQKLCNAYAAKLAPLKVCAE
ncbi:lysine decarboxylase transcriptional regulator, CadC [Glaciecola sp. KUL10]|nr:lysine decarboxylase transcriptional regulator, CadC [Glaciecola sp. KUL10]